MRHFCQQPRFWLLPLSLVVAAEEAIPCYANTKRANANLGHKWMTIFEHWAVVFFLQWDTHLSVGDVFGCNSCHPGKCWTSFQYNRLFCLRSSSFVHWPFIPGGVHKGEPFGTDCRIVTRQWLAMHFCLVAYCHHPNCEHPKEFSGASIDGSTFKTFWTFAYF